MHVLHSPDEHICVIGADGQSLMDLQTKELYSGVSDFVYRAKAEGETSASSGSGEGI